MTDRELLELAAKAAGLVVHAKNQAGRDACGAGDVGLWIVNVSTCWNPLIDDGDSRWLQVELRLSVLMRDHRVEVISWPQPPMLLGFSDEHPPQVKAWEPYGSDPRAAVRRAVLRAAAEIGRTMP